MKKNIITYSVLLFINLVFCQSQNKISGKWQSYGKEITSMYNDMYEFFQDGRFSFSPNGYDGLNRIISICGKFKLEKDSITFVLISEKQLIGGYPIRSEITTLSDSWEIINAKEKIVKYKKKIKEKAKFHYCRDSSYILIDDKKFYKID